VAFIPLVQLKVILARWIAALSPVATLLLLALPAALVLPLKMLALWLMATGEWIEGVGVFVFAKLGAIGTTAFVFDAGRHKLLQLGWFRAIYDCFLSLRQWAHALVDPIVRRIKHRLRLLRPNHSLRAFRLLQRLRRHVRLPRPLEQ